MDTYSVTRSFAVSCDQARSGRRSLRQHSQPRAKDRHIIWDCIYKTGKHKPGVAGVAGYRIGFSSVENGQQSISCRGELVLTRFDIVRLSGSIESIVLR